MKCFEHLFSTKKTYFPFFVKILVFVRPVCWKIQAIEVEIDFLHINIDEFLLKFVLLIIQTRVLIIKD